MLPAALAPVVSSVVVCNSYWCDGCKIKRQRHGEDPKPGNVASSRRSWQPGLRTQSNVTLTGVNARREPRLSLFVGSWRLLHPIIAGSGLLRCAPPLSHDLRGSLFISQRLRAHTPTPVALCRRTRHSPCSHKITAQRPKSDGRRLLTTSTHAPPSNAGNGTRTSRRQPSRNRRGRTLKVRCGPCDNQSRDV